MKNLLILAILTVPLALVIGCGGDDDDGPTTPPPPTDAEVLAAGWTAFEAADYAGAEAEFDELLSRDALVAEANDGLGWTLARQNDAGQSRTHFEAAFDAGADTLGIADQAYAGLAFAEHADGDFTACLAAAGEVSAGWTFAHDSDLDRDDVTLLEAMAHYALGQFAESLAAVQELDPAFTADVATVEGRAALAAKIEELAG